MHNALSRRSGNETRPRHLTRASIKVGIVAFDGVGLLELTGPLEVFTRAHCERLRYKTSIIGLSARRIVSDCGLPIRATHLLHDAPQLDTLVIPGGTGALRNEVVKQISDWLTTAGPSFRRIIGISQGVHAIAASGILDGRTVTTHWRFAAELAQAFPKIRVSSAAPFIRDGSIYSCAGAPAAIELSVALVAEDHGRGVALDVARELMTRLRPPGASEEAFAGFDYQIEPSDRVTELPTWITHNLCADLSIDVLAERACLCRRHFTRVFKQRFGKTAADFVEEARLNEACRRLRASHASIKTVAAEVGFASGDAFRRAFRRRLGISPDEFRTQESLRSLVTSENRSL
jgi:transcriptional regulator GlxA family with amidase domain